MSALDLVRATLFLLYAPIVLLVYWRLYPRLSDMGKWLITFILATQVIALTLGTAFVNDKGYVAWLWDLDGEYNFPATLASAQLALVGFVLLLTAWLAKSAQVWQRIYFIGIALVFLHLGRDEFLQFHDAMPGWEIGYAQLGVAVALATALLNLQIQRQQRKWGFCILAGLAIAATGAPFC